MDKLRFCPQSAHRIRRKMVDTGGSLNKGDERGGVGFEGSGREFPKMVKSVGSRRRGWIIESMFGGHARPLTSPALETPSGFDLGGI